MKHSPEHLQKLNDQAILAQNGSQEAKAWLLSALQNMCRMVVFRSDDGSTGLTDDLIQEASLGILHAIKTFDPSYNLNFYSHAFTWAQSHVRKYLRQNRRAIRLPDSKRLLKAYRYICRLPVDERNAASVNAKRIATELSITEDHVKIAAGYLGTHEMSTSLSIATRSDSDDDAITLEDILVDTQTPESILELDQQEQVTQSSLDRLMGCLNDKERIVVRRRLLVEDTMQGPTLMELGAEIGVSGERIRQLEGIAMKKMRAVSVSLAA